jgi:hypothetical protein
MPDKRNEVCCHGNFEAGKTRVLGLQCNCSWALQIFSRAARYISKLERHNPRRRRYEGFKF